MCKMVKVSTTFAPAENSTFALNGWFMHTQSQYYRNKPSLQSYIHYCTIIASLVVADIIYNYDYKRL